MFCNFICKCEIRYWWFSILKINIKNMLKVKIKNKFNIYMYVKLWKYL